MTRREGDEKKPSLSKRIVRRLKSAGGVRGGFCLFPNLTPLKFPRDEKPGLERDAERIRGYWRTIGEWRTAEETATRGRKN